MNFISQSIVFALALMGTLFKSTKTDDHGKTLYTSSGLPVLTTTGKIVISLLSVSFAISLLTIWQKNKSEDDARQARVESDNKLEQVRKYNEGIDYAVKQVLKLSSDLSDDQKQKFQDVLTQQKTTGTDIAAGINTSANLLQGRIQSSSALLRGGINTSIDLLNHSTRSVAALADPITTIEVTVLDIEVPLTHPSLGRYRNRLETGIREYIAATAASPETPNPNNLYIDRSNGKFLVTIGHNGPLLPNPSSETVAYNVLTVVNLDIDLHKNPLAGEQLTDPRSPTDLNVPVVRRLLPSAGDPGFGFTYDMNKHRAVISVLELKFNRPPLDAAVGLGDLNRLQPYTNWNKPAGGKITGVPELAGSQLVARFPSVVSLVFGSNLPTADIPRDIDEVRKQIQLNSLIMVLSSELSLQYINEPGPSTIPNGLVMRMERKTDRNGFPLYVYNFPNSF